MIGKVEPIISNCTFEKVSKELLAILPVRMSKNICNKENKKYLKSIKKSLIGKAFNCCSYSYELVRINTFVLKLIFLKQNSY